ncbi:LysR family transcriptional regulator [Aeromicrobium wangtongii]|uniref:LysR family transcriptional regulator n=1 Tax=Aeromicrobium wangtongii TaxID=2969247 RepID=UPI0020176A7B|nr:LysR family transcriptional regulator [Aeromicrobium wangtongii]MCL3816944.1 LysR family transcriptional regulator [Aeromicrobium wangtongii]
METRELRYFVAVAEELHFGRAADRLGIAQPPLSRAISQLERRMGVTLLERDSRSVTMTPAGEALLHEGRAALDAMEAAEHRARRAAVEMQAPRLVISTKAGASSELLAKLLNAYAAELGSVHVDVMLCPPGEQGRPIRTGRADVAILHKPFDDTTGLDTEELLTEGQVVVLPAGHPLTAKDELRLADLDGLTDLPMPRWPAPDGTYADGPGPEVQSHSQLLQLIALGRTLMVAPDSCRAQLGEGLVAKPLADAPAVATVIAWPPASRSRAVADLVRTATRL